MINITEEDANELFEIIKGFRGWEEITREHIEEFNYEEIPEHLFGLVGYKAKYVSDEDHRHDGQMVDYTFIFESPEGKKTKIHTEMCLMVDWNHWDDETIK